MKAIVWFGLAVVLAAAAVLSFDGLRGLALTVGIPDHLAWLLPIAVDAGAAVSCATWLGGSTVPDAARYAGRMTWALLAATVVGNAGHLGMVAEGITPPWWVAVLVGAIAPAVVGATVHLIVLVGRPEATQPTDELPSAADQAEIAVAEESAGVPVLTAALAQAWVYRLVDAEGALLYVGITQNLSSRLAHHRRSKSWWPEVANVETEVFATRRDALAAEAKAIFEEGPRYNLAPGTYADAALIAELNRAAAGEKLPLPDRRDAVNTDSRAAICDDLQAIARRTGRQFTQDEVKTMYGIGTDKAAWARRQLGWWPQAVDSLEAAR